MKPPREIPAALRPFWATFESAQPGIVSDRFYEVCIFGDDEQTADALADLALRRVPTSDTSVACECFALILLLPESWGARDNPRTETGSL